MGGATGSLLGARPEGFEERGGAVGPGTVRLDEDSSRLELAHGEQDLVKWNVRGEITRDVGELAPIEKRRETRIDLSLEDDLTVLVEKKQGGFPEGNHREMRFEPGSGEHR